MNSQHKELIDLEKRFWQALVDEDADTAVSLLAEPALLVSDHGAMKFDHATYRAMASQGPMVVKAFRLGDIQVEFPLPDVAVLTYQVTQTIAGRNSHEATTQQMADSSTWIRRDGHWTCAMHTETPLAH